MAVTSSGINADASSAVGCGQRNRNLFERPVFLCRNGGTIHPHTHIHNHIHLHLQLHVQHLHHTHIRLPIPPSTLTHRCVQVLIFKYTQKAPTNPAPNFNNLNYTLPYPPSDKTVPPQSRCPSGPICKIYKFGDGLDVCGIILDPLASE